MWQGRLKGLLSTMLKPFYCRVSITAIAMLAYANGRISQPFWQSSEFFFLNLKIEIKKTSRPIFGHFQASKKLKELAYICVRCNNMLRTIEM